MPSSPAVAEQSARPTTPPAARPDASWVLALAAAAIVVRAPGSFYLLAAAPVAVIVVHGLTWWRLQVAPLWGLLGIATLSSGVAALSHPGWRVESLVVALIMVAWAVALTTAPRPRHTARWVVSGLGAGLGATWLIGLGEVVTGRKLLPVLYPKANTVDAVVDHRLFVSATFPNYNDFSIALVMLSLLVGAWLLWARTHHPVLRMLAWGVLATSLIEVAVMGSRGALIAAVVGFGLLAIRSARRHQPWLLRARVVIPVLTIGALVGIAVFTSPYVQDHSAQLRAQIAENIDTMIRAEPLNGWFGWGSYADFRADALARFGPILMDPHNLLVEIVVWYGVLTLAAYLIAWATLAWRGFAGAESDSPGRGSWQADAAWTVSAVFPLMGIVPSSTLRYYVVWLFLIAGWVLVGQSRDRRRAVATPSTKAIDETATTSAANSASTTRRTELDPDVVEVTGPSTTAS